MSILGSDNLFSNSTKGVVPFQPSPSTAKTPLRLQVQQRRPLEGLAAAATRRAGKPANRGDAHTERKKGQKRL